MKNANGVYSLFPSDSDVNFEDIYSISWDSDELEMKERKKKKKKRKKKKAQKKLRKKKAQAKKKARAKKKAQKEERKQSQREFTYRMLEKSIDVTLYMVSDITKMYAESKFLSSRYSK